ncbi:glycosyltransferase [Clostridium saccharobutylicum]|uniref:Putative glycosyltransferase EpsD n=1 Tax=Clostridium saccharobutylicum DSM 13864 TaxID=1345695 RepID=U5MX93_CLOSA|nr:glycosyltransferase [Clostridium saccharobutylicum]AGX45168.1 putative glycosyltransferase EpsD [Clostridium saccharobutylicum DSM 13864]AQR92447.1 putative glycosyltransferase EpsD [Clostridium saccharobutylicum]AQS02350.1 putative glycosyltransferase EpsD [Clostridium saccharobutylicum]AQS16333.1 putative glycosyltransferase EpsD [Clostridium saccharobutylicum]MBA2905011.1 glycosyltransferase EpsD [Clostridium saccharobutylicum]
MKKILFVASTLSHIENFHMPYIKYFKEHGYNVHVIGKANNKSELKCIDKIIPVPFQKNMFSIKNFSNAIKISKIIKSENYDIISLHTTLAAFFTRLGIMLSFNKPNLVINTVHGYLFDNNSSFIKKIIMVMAEKITKCVTDTIIVMNRDDYKIAQKHKLYRNNIYSIDGMGINLSSYSPISYEDKIALRKKHHFSINDFFLIYVAEFSKRKNQKFIINTVDKLVKDGYTNIKLLLLGDGILLDELKTYTKELGINNNVFFIGYTKDTCTYYQMADICVSSSRIEGLPFNIMEAMCVGLPIVASNVKGHKDLVIPNENGFLFEYDNDSEFYTYIKTIYDSKEIQYKMSNKSLDLVENYSINNILPKTINIILNEYKSHI